jgi:hypothetical protein
MLAIHIKSKLSLYALYQSTDRNNDFKFYIGEMNFETLKMTFNI